MSVWDLFFDFEISKLIMKLGGFFMETMKCPVCGSESIKKGKIHGIASLQSLNSRTSLGGSELIVSFCSDCGEVLRMKVADPEKIIYVKEE